jgi:hypothetical protein
LPCVTITPDELNKIIQKTFAFLRGCRRDLLDCPLRSASEPGYNWDDFISTAIELTHRTVFDYLHTPEMQVLLSEHTPNHFKDAHFLQNLDVAACKTVVIDPHDRYGPLNGWGQLSLGASLLLRWKDYLDNLKTENLETGIHNSLGLAQTLEEVSLYHLKALGGFLKVRPVWYSKEVTLTRNCTWLSITFALFGLFTFTDAVVAVAPHLLGSVTSASTLVDHLNHTLFQAGQYDKSPDVALLRWLFQAGVDPNFECVLAGTRAKRSSSWRMFLEQLTKNTFLSLPHTKHAVAVSHDWLSKNPSDTRVIATQAEVYANPYVQDAIKTFIEFGTELEPEVVEMLTNRLPKPDGNSFDWPKFLTAYSQPAKRIELEEDRRERLRHWPEDWLTGRDRRFLKSAPDLSEEWWSDRGRRLLSLT